MLDVAKNNPVIVSENAVKNYSFITDNGNLYLISNTVTGDDSYVEDITFPAGEYLNGFLVKAWEGKKLIVDGKHIDGGVAELSKDDVLVVADDGGLEAGEAEGIHFVVTDTGVTLTEAAVKVEVVLGE